MNRLPYLDYLRGVAALFIMVYHYLAFAFGNPDTNSFLKKTGLYGVSVFYVLSGLTLYHVYFKVMKPDGRDLMNFFLKRFFRIFPLLWLVTLASIYFKGLPSFENLFLNLTGLFGLVKPAANIATGGWSIGNELVFYLFFPLFIYLLKYSRILFYMLAGLLFACYLYFAFIALPSLGTMENSWEAYINPLNQVFLFLSGIMIGLLFQDKRMNQHLLLSLFVIVLGIYSFFPVQGDALNLVVGGTRLVYTLLCVLIVLCAYKFEFHLPSFLSKPLALLGEVSYGLYLLHPLVFYASRIVFSVIAKYVYAFPLPVMLISAGMGSLILSFLVYTYFEKPFIRFGKRVAVKVGLPMAS